VISSSYGGRVDGGTRPSRRSPRQALEGAQLMLVGGFACHQNDEPLELPPSTQRLLAFLALQSRGPTRSGTAGALWPDVAEHHARATLRSTIWRLARLGPDLVVAAADHIVLSPTVRVDVWDQWNHAQALLRRASSMREDELEGPQLGGWLLPGWSDDWTVIARERLHQLQLHALEALARRLLVLGRHGAAIQSAMQAVQLDPLRESSYRTLTQIHLDEGNVVEALRCYDTFRHLSWTELGVSPSRRFDELIQPYRPRGSLPATRSGRTARQLPRRWA
jgi:DNA-binding SARP family transcriptional activator